MRDSIAVKELPVETRRLSPLLLKNVHRAIFSLALPGMATMVFIALYELVDAFWVGKLGAEALAAVSGSSFIIWALYSLSEWVGVGVYALVARAYGVLDYKRASEVTSQGIGAVLLLALVFMALGLAYLDPLLNWMQLETEVHQLAREYLTVILLGLVTIFLLVLYDAAFRGSGDALTPSLIIGGFLVFNAILDPFLIFGVGPFPRLGVQGAAWATVISRLLGLVACALLLKRRHIHPRLRLPSELSLIRSILRIGFPIAFGHLIFSLVYVGLARIISLFGTAPLAALGVCHRIEGVAYFACVGFGEAAATLVGQNLGAGRLRQAENSAWWTVLYGIVATGVVAIFFVLIPERLMALFIADPEVIREGARYLRIVGFFEIFLGVEVILEGAFSGAGDTVPPMMISIPLTTLRLPLAYFLSGVLQWGTSGIWWAIALSTFLKGVLLAFWFQRGRWKYRKVW